MKHTVLEKVIKPQSLQWRVVVLKLTARIKANHRFWNCPIVQSTWSKYLPLPQGGQSFTEKNSRTYQGHSSTFLQTYRNDDVLPRDVRVSNVSGIRKEDKFLDWETEKFSHRGNDVYELLKFKDFQDPLPSFHFQGSIQSSRTLQVLETEKWIFFSRTFKGRWPRCFYVPPCVTMEWCTWLALQPRLLTRKYAFTFSSPSCSEM